MEGMYWWAESSKGSRKMKKEIKTLILMTFACLFLLPAEEVLGAEQTASVMIPVVQQFEIRNQSSEKLNQTIRYELTSEDADAPMPDGSSGDRYTFTMTGSEKKQIGLVVYDHVGVWHYALRQSVPKEEKGYDYDRQIYQIAVYVENLADGSLGTQVIVTNKEGNKVDEIRFKNGYTGSKKQKVARTGDASDAGLWLILGVAAAGSAVVIIRQKKRPAE